MAYATTYSDLLTELQAYVDNTLTEFTDQLPNIVARAQDVIQGDLDLAMWNTTTASVVAGAATTLARGQWIKVHSIFVPSLKRYLDLATLDKVRLFGSTGTPRYYAEYTESYLMIGPAPATTLAVDVTALTRLPALSASSQTNWITNNAPELLFWQTLVGCETFLISPERVAEFQANYTAALARMQSNNRDTEANHNAPLRGAARPAVRVPG